MARWTAIATIWTPAAVADTTNMANNGFMALKGGTGAQRINIWEVKLGGLATAPAPMPLFLARDFIASGTLSGGKLAALDFATADLAGMPTTGISAATTAPQRDAARYLLDLSYNAYGGLCRIQLPPEGPIGMYGNVGTTSTGFGEVSVSLLTGGTAGATSTHIIFETV